jgi:hypothetical protein
MSRQYFADAPYSDPMIASPSAIVATTETALWTPFQYTPIPASDARAAKAYKLTAGGIYSTGASGTLTITPRFGNVIGGVTLGASTAQTVPVSLTNEAWFMEAILIMRTVNNGTATSSTAMLNGAFFGSGVAATAASSGVVAFGGTSGTVDTTVAAGLWIGWTLSVAGSVTTQTVFWQSLN